MVDNLDHRRSSRGLNDETLHFQLANATNGVNCSATCTHASPPAEDAIELPVQNGQDLDLDTLKTQVNGNAGLWHQLKAIPLISYYKQHRVPPAPAMETQHESNTIGAVPVQLPRKESVSAVEPPNGVVNKTLENVIRTPGRQPSPQPTHLSVPGPAHHMIPHEEGTGYVAPVFEGKERQMEEGMLPIKSLSQF